jgi:hypothetical protein
MTAPPEADPAPAPLAAEPSVARKQIAALMLLFREMRQTVRAQGAEIALLRAQITAFRQPAPVPDGYVCLKVAAHALGRSDEWLRRRCTRGEIDCRQAVPGGPWYVRLGGTLAAANSPNREIVLK